MFAGFNYIGERVADVINSRPFLYSLSRIKITHRFSVNALRTRDKRSNCSNLILVYSFKLSNLREFNVNKNLSKYEYEKKDLRLVLALMMKLKFIFRIWINIYMWNN